MDDFLKLTGSYAFPIAVTLYLLWERKTAYAELTKAVYKLKDTIELWLFGKSSLIEKPPAVGKEDDK